MNAIELTFAAEKLSPAVTLYTATTAAGTYEICQERGRFTVDFRPTYERGPEFFARNVTSKHGLKTLAAAKAWAAEHAATLA